MQREFADWFPGPVLLEKKTKVTLWPKVMFHGKDYSGCSGKVEEHLPTDSCTVSVRIDDEEMPAESEKTLKVAYSILKFPDMATEGASTMQTIIGALLSNSPAAGAGTAFTLIGYNEFICGGKIEREYWLSLGSALSLPIKAGELPVHVHPTGRLKLCVMHVQYRAFETSVS